MKKKIVLGIVFCLLINKIFATVDYLLVNHITNELYWADEDHEGGFIGWEGVSENYEEEEEKYLSKGYKYTKFPFKIESGISHFAASIGGNLFH